jgi:Zn-finger nucleic acid-binding protein
MHPPCPACRTPTVEVHWDEVAGFECAKCAGHSIRPDELQKFLHGRRDSFAQLMVKARCAPRSVRPLQCPDCRTPSYRALRAGLIHLDVCATCVGIYFDRHEARLYVRQIRARSGAGALASAAVTGIDGLDALLDLLTNFTG